jgi:hypothetical protein
MKPLIKVVINTKKLKEKIKYDGWYETKEYFDSFIEDCLIVIKVNIKQGRTLKNEIELDDDKRL